ncbi:hypothetical protein JCM3765_006431 [Sporobolomyces pararoseus]
MASTRLLTHSLQEESDPEDVVQEEDFPVRSDQHAKNKELVANATKVGEWACWIGLASAVVGGIVCITGFVASPQASTKHRTWFGMAFGAWVSIAVVLAVLFWELMDKLGRHGVKLVARCRLAYVLNLTLLLIGTGASLILYGKYSKLVKRISISTAQLPKDNIAKQLQRKVSHGAESLARSAAGSVRSIRSKNGKRISQASTLVESESEEDRLPQDVPEWDRKASFRSGRIEVMNTPQPSSKSGASDFSGCDEQAQQPKNRESRLPIPRKPVPLPESTPTSYSDSSDNSQSDRKAQALPLILSAGHPPSHPPEFKTNLPSWKRPEELFFPSSQTSSDNRPLTVPNSANPESKQGTTPPQYQAYSPPPPSRPPITQIHPPSIASSRTSSSKPSKRSSQRTPKYKPPPPPPLPLVPGSTYNKASSYPSRRSLVKGVMGRDSRQVSDGIVEKRNSIPFDDEGYDSDPDSDEYSSVQSGSPNPVNRGHRGSLRVVNS